MNHLANVAVSRLQGELAKEGREPASAAFKRSRENVFPEKVTNARSPEKAKGESVFPAFLQLTFFYNLVNIAEVY